MAIDAIYEISLLTLYSAGMTLDSIDFLVVFWFLYRECVVCGEDDGCGEDLGWLILCGCLMLVNDSEPCGEVFPFPLMWFESFTMPVDNRTISVKLDRRREIVRFNPPVSCRFNPPLSCRFNPPVIVADSARSNALLRRCSFSFDSLVDSLIDCGGRTREDWCDFVGVNVVD